MRKLLVPVLLLATAALTSCTVLPIINQLQPLNLDGQQNDNIPIYTYRHQSRNILNNIFCKRSYSIPTNNPLLKICDIFRAKQDNMAGENSDEIINKKYDYNGDEFRKEQWHNYPRQLDRLHRYFYEYDANNVSPDPDEPAPKTDNTEYRLSSEKANEYRDSNDVDDYEPSDDVTDLIHLKIFSNNEPNLNLCSNLDIFMNNECKENMDGDLLISNKVNPANNLKVKQEETLNSLNYERDIMDKEKKVKKRIFSLWSRLQGMSHKGHELPHRRHIHAFYGLPDGAGSGALTAETRDGLRRPPGAPLRWG